MNKRSSKNNFEQVDLQAPEDIERVYTNHKTPQTHGTPKYKRMYKNSNKLTQGTDSGIRKYFQSFSEKSVNRYNETRKIASNHNSKDTTQQTPTTENLEQSKILQQKNAEINSLLKEYENLTSIDNMDVKAIFKKTSELINSMNQRHDMMMNHLLNNTNKSCEFVTSEINSLREEIEKVKSSHKDEIETLQIVDACRNDLKKIWIRFKFRGEAQQIRESGNYPTEIKRILGKMNIKFDLNILPIETAFFQDRKFGNQEVPEIALCCIFTNSTIAKRVKTDIIKFNKNLELNGKRELIRYFSTMNWTGNVWQILKVCIELKSHNLINNVFVSNEGIKVQITRILNDTDDLNLTVVDYNANQNSFSTIKVNNSSTLDNLRKLVNDFNKELPASEVYNRDYFSLEFEKRKELRLNACQQESTNDEMSVCDDFNGVSQEC